MQAALTTPATRTRCARTSTRSPIFPRHKGGTGGCSWGLVVRGAAEAEDLEYHPKVALRCQERGLGAAEDDERAAGQPLELLDRCGPVATRETMLGRRSDVLRRSLAQAPVHGLPIEELDPPLDVGAGHLARRRRDVDGLPPADLVGVEDHDRDLRPGGDVARVPRLRIGHPEELPALCRGVPDRRD